MWGFGLYSFFFIEASAYFGLEKKENSYYGSAIRTTPLCHLSLKNWNTYTAEFQKGVQFCNGFRQQYIPN